MRCLALAQAWQDAGGTCVFATAQLPAALRERVVTEGFPAEEKIVDPGSEADAAWTVGTASSAGAEWVVLDGYAFDSAFQRRLKESGRRVLVIDDYGHAGRYEADLVLNQNLHARPELYARRAASTEFLLGPRFALLRREFHRWRGWERSVPDAAGKVLVTLGGSDPDNVTLMAMQALSQLRVDGLEAAVVVGASNPNLAGLRKEAASARFALRLLSNVSDMPALMAWADVAVSAGGGTSSELAFFGLPGLTFVLAENQRRVAESCAATGLARNLGSPDAISAASLASELTALLADRGSREEMSRRGQELVDGRGRERVTERMTGRVAEGLSLRLARAEDCRLVWEWANDSAVRSASFSGDPIPWESHREWFARKLTDPASVYYIATDDKGDPLGQVRFDVNVEGREAVISVSLTPESRGRGLGPKLIRLATELVLEEREVETVLAYIKQENARSRLAFLKAGYRDGGPAPPSGHPSWRLVCRKGPS
jgi:UDP-2,4-diacetamido-2,4,6-trideoxy-beta-L-altropyranose hydrolase